MSLKVEGLWVKKDEKVFLENVNLELEVGEFYLITGKNGSGKSTFLKSIAGQNELESSGKVIFERTDISTSLKEELEKEEISFLSEKNRIKLNLLDIQRKDLVSRLGIFYSSQAPIEIPGVSYLEYLRIIYNIHNQNTLPLFKFRKYLLEICEILKFNTKLLERDLNEGFSGGEKKKSEILQMFLICPEIILLDEIDSGLDNEATKDIFNALKIFKSEKKDSTLVMVSHAQNILEYFDFKKTFKVENKNIF